MNNENGVFTKLFPEMEKDIEEHTLLTKLNKKYAKDVITLRKVSRYLFKEIIIKNQINNEKQSLLNTNMITKESSKPLSKHSSKNKLNNTPKVMLKGKLFKSYTNPMILNYIIKDKPKPNHRQCSPTLIKASHICHRNYDSSLLLSSNTKFNTGFFSNDNNKSSKTIVINCNNNSTTTLKSNSILNPFQLNSPYRKKIVLKGLMNSNSESNRIKYSPQSYKREILNNNQSHKINQRYNSMNSIQDRLLSKRKKEDKNNNYTASLLNSLNGSSLALIKDMNHELTQIMKDKKKDKQRRNKMNELFIDESSQNKLLIKEELKNEYKEHLNSGDNYKRYLKHNEMKHQLDLISRIKPEILYKQRNYPEGRLGFAIEKETVQTNKRAKSTIRRYN